VPAARALDAAEVAADLASIDAADSERVLRRAIELSVENVVVAEQFPVSTLEQVAAELHVPITAVADALAEYRTGALDTAALDPSGAATSPRRGVLDRLIGPRLIKIRHRTKLSDQDAVENLSDWLKRRHRLRIRINPEGTVVGVRRRGVVPIVVRGVRSATGTAGLSGVKEVRAAAVTGEEGQTSLCLVVDLSDHRTQSVVAGSAVAAGGTLVVSAVAAVTAPVTLVGVPVAVGVGWITSRLSHRHRVRRVTEEAEMTADHVAAGSTPPTLTSEVAERLVGRRRRPTP